MTSRKSKSSRGVDHEAVLTFAYDDETPDPAERARRVERAVRPEVGEIAGDRTRAALDREDGTVRVRVDAADLVALRAGLNTWSTLVRVAEAVDAAGSDAIDAGRDTAGSDADPSDSQEL